MLSIFKSKKEEDIFNPPSEIYYEFYRELEQQLWSYNNGNMIIEGRSEEYAPDEEPAIQVSCIGYDNFSYEVLCEELNKIPIIYCPNISCHAEKVTKYIDEDGDEQTRDQTYWDIDIQICVVDNEVRCYILQLYNNDDDDLIERMTYQLNLEYKQSVVYRGRERRLYVPKNQELFVLDSFVNRRNDGSYYFYTFDIVEKLVTLCKRIISFGEKEGEID